MSEKEGNKMIFLCENWGNENGGCSICLHGRKKIFINDGNKMNFLPYIDNNFYWLIEKKIEIFKFCYFFC